MFAWLVQENGGATTVSRNSGVSRVHINRLIRGFENTQRRGRREYSLLDADPHTISGLLAAFSLSDARAWEMLGIPVELRQRWRSFQTDGGSSRLPHAATTSVEVALTTDPLVGELFLPVGFTVVIDQTGAASGWVIAEMDDRYYAYKPHGVPASARVLGTLTNMKPTPVSVDN